MPSTTVLAHAIIAGIIIIAYTILSGLGHDANALLGLLAGQGLGAGVTAVTSETAPEK